MGKKGLISTLGAAVGLIGAVDYTIFNAVMSRNSKLVEKAGGFLNKKPEDAVELPPEEEDERIIWFGEQKFEDYTKVLTLIAVLLTVVAGLMAYFILLNICNMYISQKKRELIIMRINGFTVREVKNYVARETIYTTAAGIVLGLGVGTGVGYQIIRFVELPHLQFVRSPYFIGWVLAVAITLIFVGLINYLSLRQVSTLKMTDL